MPYQPVKCRCAAMGDPVPRPCHDDLFCSQCGGAVAWLDSPSLLPNPEGKGWEALWLYPTVDESGRPCYEFAIDFRQVWPDGTETPLSPDLALIDCRAQQSLWFEEAIEAVQVAGGLSVVCRLRPKPRGRGPTNLTQPLDMRGVSGRIVLSGGCGRPARGPGGQPYFEFWAFNAPEFSLTVKGPSVQEEEEHRTWQLWLGGLQELTIGVEPTNSRVFLGERAIAAVSAKFDDPETRFRLVRGPATDSVVGPGQPAEMVVSLDSSGWTEEKPCKTLAVELDFALQTEPFRKDIPLVRQFLGILEFGVPNPLVVKEMFYGESDVTPAAEPAVLPRELPVTNVGHRSLMAWPPTIEYQAGQLEWLKVEWADDSPHVVTLDRGESRLLRLRIDLANVTPEIYPPGSSFKAVVRVEDSQYGMTRDLVVSIESVGHRRLLPMPLAIDFGNTHTYAATVVSDETGVQVRSLLGQGDEAETFDSALFFTELPLQAPPSYVIGPEARQRGVDRPELLGPNLKRLLSNLRPFDARGIPREITDSEHPFNQKLYSFLRASGPEARFSLRELLVFYLAEVIRACERRERRTVRHLGLSYPANFGPEPRRALDEVIKDLQATWKRDHREHASAIQFDAVAADEASAVALGFVLDPDVRRSHVAPLYEEGQARFTVASFDFGGGSIDVSLVRFVIEGSPVAPSYSSELLYLGGAEHFGGDNVTAAVFQMLAGRIAAAARASSLPKGEPAEAARRFITEAAADGAAGWADLPLGKLSADKNLPPRNRANRQALWNVAESAKRFACEAVTGERQRKYLRDAWTAALKSLRLRPMPAEDDAIRVKLTAALDAGLFDIDLADLYAHKIEHDLSGRGNYTVESALRNCVDELHEAAQVAGEHARPRFVLLAGAGSRLPLAAEMLRSTFGVDPIVDPTRPKSKVAHGLVRFLHLHKNSPARIRGLQLARDVNHAPIVYPLGAEEPPLVWVPSCARLVGGPWHPLKEIHLGAAGNAGSALLIEVFRRAFPWPESIGVADLSTPADLPVPGVEPVLPAILGDLEQAEVRLRIDGEEDMLRIRVKLGEAEYGDWRVKPKAPGT